MVMGAVSPADSSDCRKYGVEGRWGWGGVGVGGVGVVGGGGGEGGGGGRRASTLP